MQPEQIRNEMELALRSAGYRMTSQRTAILEFLTSTTEHPGAYRIYEEVRRVQPGLSLATVYNTLQVLNANGLIRTLTFGEENRYETNLSLHINLICTSCGRIQDFEAAQHMSPREIQEKVGFAVQSYRMEYLGLCEQCAALAGRNGKQDDRNDQEPGST